MSKKTFQLISGIIGGVQAIAVAVVTFTTPEYATAINGAIVIVGTAAIEACSKFIKDRNVNISIFLTPSTCAAPRDGSKTTSGRHVSD